MRLKSTLLALLLALLLAACNTATEAPQPDPDQPHPEEPAPEEPTPEDPTPEDPTPEEPDPTEPEELVRPEGNVTGIIVTSDGTALADTPISFQEYDPRLAGLITLGFTAFTDEHGQFGFTVTEPGTYALQAYGEDEGVFQLVTVEAAGDGIAPMDLELSAAQYGIVTLTVHNPDGSPATGSIAYLAGTNHMGLTNHLGEAVLPKVAAGDYVAGAQSDEHGDATPVTVTVTSGKGVSSSPLVLESLAPVIHRISREWMFLEPSYYGPETLETMVIEGFNFGADQGTGQVLVGYGDTEVATQHMLPIDFFGTARVMSWSDTEIVVAPQSPGFHYWGALNYPDGSPDIWNRMQVATPHGTSNLSDRLHSLMFEYGTTGADYTFPVMTPTDPIEFRAVLTGSDPELVAQAEVSFQSDYGSVVGVTPGEVVSVERGPFIEGGPTTTLYQAAWPVVFQPNAAEDGDRFIINGTSEGLDAGFVECRLIDIGHLGYETPWEWDCF